VKVCGPTKTAILAGPTRALIRGRAWPMRAKKVAAQLTLSRRSECPPEPVKKRQATARATYFAAASEASDLTP
jgi:hypothetical protein